MVKTILALVVVYLLLQFVFDVDVNETVKPIIEPIAELVEEQSEQTLPEFGKDLWANLSEQNLAELLESDQLSLDELSQLIEDQQVNLEQLAQLIEEQEFDTEAAQQKLEQLKRLVEEKIEQN